RFIGYTGNERLERRTALVYDDDIGLSAARARRAMEEIAAELGLTEKQAEFEGRGYVHSSDVVNAGFIQGRESFVVVQVVYDEIARSEERRVGKEGSSRKIAKQDSRIRASAAGISGTH